MYAFAVWHAGSLTLARDPLGMKPLYLYSPPGAETVYFASEIKAFLQLPGVRPELNLTAIADTALVGHPGGGATYFADVRTLAPGEVLTLRRGGGRTTGHSARAAGIGELRWTMDRDAPGELRAKSALAAAVDSHTDTDLDVTIALSGGIDSTLLACVAQRPLKSFTVCDLASDRDPSAARNVAAELGLDHHEVVLDPTAYAAHIAQAVVIEEQPPSLAGLPSYFMFQEIAKHSRICLMGEGADEAFCGYPDHLDPLRHAGKHRETRALLARLGLSPSAAAVELARYRYEDTGAPPGERAYRLNLGEALTRLHLEIADKYSMACSVEVRLPYLDADVVKAALALPAGSRLGRDGAARKVLLTESLAGYLDPVRLGIVREPKLGFPASGIGHLRGFAAFCDRHLPDHYVKGHEFGQVYRRKHELLLFDLFVFLMFECRGRVPRGFRLREFMRSLANVG